MTHVTDVRNREGSFELVANNREVFRARTVILATGLKDTLPAIDGIHDYYGKSLFSCPYCDGWELKDRALVVIAEGQNAFHMAKLVWNWSRDVLVCTNGQHVLTREQQETLRKKGIQVVEDRITALVGKQGQLERIVFATQEERRREGGFVASQLLQASPFGEVLGCEINAMGGSSLIPLGERQFQACMPQVMSQWLSLIN
ncbi:MAG: NAD(P)/FAD-dependent oxidoreductase [Ktedonobacteraceae bacterium]